MRIFLSMIFASVLISGLASAGQETHGGDVLVCQNPVNSPKPSEYSGVILDYYVAQLPSATDPSRKVVDISQMTTNQVIDLFRERLRETYFVNAFDRVALEIGDLSQWVVAEGLTDVQDDGMGFKIPERCGLYQGAIRMGNIVYIDKKISSYLSPAQLGLLVVHEILYKLATEKGLTTSATTRHVVRAILEETVNRRALLNAVHAMGWPLSNLEVVSDTKGKNTYTAKADYGAPLAEIEVLKNDTLNQQVFFRLSNLELPNQFLGIAKCGDSSYCSVEVTRTIGGSDFMKTGDILKFSGDSAVAHIYKRWNRETKQEELHTTLYLLNQ